MSFLIVSCSSVERRATRIETLIPSEKTLPIPDNMSIAIVASIYPDTRSTERRERGFPNDSLMMITTAFALKAKLEASPKFAGYEFPVYEVPRSEVIEVSRPLTQPMLDNVAAEANVDFLLSVEYQALDITYSQGKGYDPDEGAFNYVQANIPYEVMFRLYDVKGKRMIDEEMVVDTLRERVNQRLYEDQEAALARLTDAHGLALTAARDAGVRYAERVSPKWVEEVRFFFTDNSQEMKLAERYSEEQDWPQAIEVWLTQVEHKDPQRAAAAAFNMALGCEIMGEYALALDWLKVARKKDPQYDSIGGEYEKVIRERIEEKLRIDQELKLSSKN